MKYSVEHRRAVRRVEASRDDLMIKIKKDREKLAATRATLKQLRRSSRG